MSTKPANAPPASLSRLQEAGIALLLFALVTVLHFQAGPTVAPTVLLQTYNWLFDFDASRYLGGWCVPGVNVSEHLYFDHVVRHPLTVVLRPACLAIEPLFSSPQVALMAVTAALAGLWTVMAYALARRCCTRLLDRLLITAFASLSAQPLMLGIVPEMYGPAMLGVGLSLLWLSGLPGKGASRGQWILAGVLNLGITVTNAMLNFIASAVTAWGTMGLKAWLRRELLLWLWIATGLLASALLLAWIYTPEHLQTIAKAAKSIWWAAHMGRGEPAPLWKVATTYLVYDVVAPINSFYQLPPGEDHLMLDYRDFVFTPAGWCALVLWLSTLCGAVVLAWQAVALRKPLLVALLWLAFNVALHTLWQYRASVYIYGAHSYPALVAILAMGYGAATVRGRRWVLATRASGALLLLLLLVNNSEHYREAISFLVANTPAR